MSESNATLAAAALALLATGKASTLALRKSLLACRPSRLSDDLLAGHLLDELNASGSETAEALATSRKTIDAGIAKGIMPVPICSEDYPPLLRRIDDAPPVIYYRGHKSALAQSHCVSVIGTRKATHHGALIAERLAEFLGQSGVSVVSGLALGIDAAAHRGALRTTTPTITVLAHGLASASPRENSGLADQIIEQGGVWVSEHPYRVPAKPEYFVQRNRIQVGLSLASVVVEGEEKSGSMTHAKFCIRNKRHLFAVLPDASIPTSRTLPEMLVTGHGATAIQTKADYQKLLEAVRGEENLRSLQT